MWILTKNIDLEEQFYPKISLQVGHRDFHWMQSLKTIPGWVGRQAPCHANRNLTTVTPSKCFLMDEAHFLRTLPIKNGWKFTIFFFPGKGSKLDLRALPGMVCSYYVLNVLIYFDHWELFLVVCFTRRLCKFFFFFAFWNAYVKGTYNCTHMEAMLYIRASLLLYREFNCINSQSPRFPIIMWAYCFVFHISPSLLMLFPPIEMIFPPSSLAVQK